LDKEGARAGINNKNQKTTDLNMVKIDKEACIGCGTCVAIAPEIFALGKDGKAYVKNPKGKGNLKDAIESCPVGAIKK
jgi:ferredoxin